MNTTTCPTCDALMPSKGVRCPECGDLNPTPDQRIALLRSRAKDALWNLNGTDQTLTSDFNHAVCVFANATMDLLDELTRGLDPSP